MRVTWVVMLTVLLRARCAFALRSSSRALGRRALRRSAPTMMPEGPEVKVHAESLDAQLAGARLVRARIVSGRYLGDGDTPGRRAPPANWSALVDALPARVERVRSRGKFLWFELSAAAPAPEAALEAAPEAAPAAAPARRELTLWSTLGLAGAWSRARGAHTRVEFDVDDGAGPLCFADARNFGTLTVATERAALDAKLARLGPSWLLALERARDGDGAGGLSLDAFRALVARQCRSARGRAVPVAKLLMDQGKSAGVGNYILCEALHAARVWPWARCGALAADEWDGLHAAVDAVVRASYRAQRDAAARRRGRDAGHLSVTRGEFGFELRVYRRARTPEGAAVRRDDGPHGRGVYWVPEMQTRGRPPEGTADGELGPLKNPYD